MITPVTQVAKTFFLDEEIAQVVAEASRNAFFDGAGYFVSTWTHNDFVAEVRDAQGGEEASRAIRARKIEEGRNA